MVVRRKNWKEPKKKDCFYLAWKKAKRETNIKDKVYKYKQDGRKEIDS